MIRFLGFVKGTNDLTRFPYQETSQKWKVDWHIMIDDYLNRISAQYGIWQDQVDPQDQSIVPVQGKKNTCRAAFFLAVFNNIISIIQTSQYARCHIVVLNTGI